MPGLFVDTAAWIGLEVANDHNHHAAVAFGQMARRRYRWVTTNWVLWETVTWLRYHTGHAAAVRFGERVQAAQRLELISVTARHEANAWEVFKRYRDKHFSFVDCASFTVMRDLRLVAVFTFDEHFRQAGFQMLPVMK
jgi:uncharacterized protein